MKSFKASLLVLFLVCLTAETNAGSMFAIPGKFGGGGQFNTSNEGCDHIAGLRRKDSGSDLIAGSRGQDSGSDLIAGSRGLDVGYTPGAGSSHNAAKADLHAISAAVDSIALEYNLPSVAFAIVTADGLSIAGAMGYADKEKGIPATGGTVYRVGSISKTFIALGIMNLVHEGELSLDDRLANIVPEVAVNNRWEESHPVLLRHLLEHTAGFRNLYLKDFVIAEDTPLPDLHDAVMRQPAYHVSLWPPGTRSVYSNPGYTLLGYIIEKYSGMPYHEYIEEMIFRPLGMENSDFLGRNKDRLAISYDRKGNPQIPRPILDHPSGFLHTSHVDMARFIRFMLERGDAGYGEFMPGELFRIMERPSSITGAGNDKLGYGMGLYSTVAKGNLGAGHDGMIEEYFSSFICFHDAGAAYFFTITHFNPTAAAALAGYFRDTLLDEIVPESENIAGHPDGIEGWYRPGFYAFAMARMMHDLFDPVKLEIVNDTLRKSGFAGPATSLISLGNGYYRTADSPSPTHWIGIHEGRAVISSSYGQHAGYFEKTSAFVALWKTWGLLISLNLFFLTSLVYLAYYLVLRSRKSSVNAGPMIWPAFGLICLILTLLLLGRLTSLPLLAIPNFWSVLAAVFSGLFAIFLAIGLISFSKGITHIKIWKRVPLYLGYAAWAYIALLLGFYGHMPLTTWIW
jgi:CubicO group peptidase (beta-lactamase class C family)